MERPIAARGGGGDCARPPIGSPEERRRGARQSPGGGARALPRSESAREARARGGQSQGRAQCGAPSTSVPAFETPGRHSPGGRCRAAPVRRFTAAGGGGCRAPWAPSDAGMNRAGPRATGGDSATALGRVPAAHPGAARMPPARRPFPQSDRLCSQSEAVALSTSRCARSGRPMRIRGRGLA